MKKIKEIKDVNNLYVINNDYCIYYNSEHIFTIISTKNYEILDTIQMERDYFIEIKDDCIYMYKNKNIYIYDDKKHKFNLFWESKKGRSLFFEDFIIEDIDEKDKVHTFLYDYASQNLLWDKTYYNNKISCSSIGPYLYAADLMMNNCSFIDKNNGNIIYDLNFKDDKFCARQFYLYNNIISTPIFNNHHLIGINADTGEKLWERENAFRQYSLNPQNGYLYGFAVERYEIINIINGDMVLQKKFENLEEKYNILVPANMSKIYGDGLYFTSNCNNRNFGKINLNTNEIEYVQPLNFKMGVNADIPIAQNGKIYVLDDQNTLHIFEE